MHRRDPRAKTVALLFFLILLATSHRALPLIGITYFGLLVAAIFVAVLPVFSILLRATIVLPFTLVFALIAFFTGEPHRALTLLGKSYLSALAVVILVSTTSLPRLLRGLESMGVPRFLLMVLQFLYRYLFVISEEAQHMRIAAWSRGASMRALAANALGFRAAAGALAVLFARSYTRAERIHRSMLARGFQGHFRLPVTLKLGWGDSVFIFIATLLPAAVRVVLERAA